MPPLARAGQRVLAGFDGTAFDEDARFLVEELWVGGLILFARNIVSPTQVKQLIQDAQASAKEQNLPPLIIAIDQEGGPVARLKKPDFPEFLGNQGINTIEDAIQFSEKMANLLLDLGINMNFAPVLDVVIDNASIMKNRVFLGKEVAALGASVIDGFQQKKLMAVGKHFPGIGRTALDSHFELPTMEESFESIQKIDLPPFEKAISHNVAGLMLSHILYTTMDKIWPASLSPAIAKTLLRDQLNYQGIVMSDDLDMKAVADHFSIDTIVEQTIQADIDWVLICHKGPNRERAVREFMLQEAMDDNAKRQADQSLKRILALKQKYLL